MSEQLSPVHYENAPDGTTRLVVEVNGETPEYALFRVLEWALQQPMNPLLTRQIDNLRIALYVALHG